MPENDDKKCQAHSGVVKEINSLKASDQRQWEAIENLQNRLPTWATIVISILTFGLGASLTYASLAARLAG